MFLCSFFFELGLVRQSAVQSITWPSRTVNPLTLQNNSENGKLLLLFSFLKVLKCCTYIKKKKKAFFSTISTMTHKFTWKWGRWSVLTETDRNQSKQSNFELRKCNFIGQLNIFVRQRLLKILFLFFKSFHPRTLNYRGKKQPCKKKGSYFCFLCFLLLNLYPFKN